MSPKSYKGKVIKGYGSFYEVRTEEGSIRCTLRGKFRLETHDEIHPVAVGDNVEVFFTDKENGTIEKILPRHNKISRLAVGKTNREHIIATNIDQGIIVASTNYPSLNTHLIDRFLVTFEQEDIEPIICINKIDLLKSFAELKPITDMYKNLSYTVILTSTLNEQGIDQFHNLLLDKTSVIIGQSGVGKSSLLNSVEPRFQLKVGEVSSLVAKGKHTTSSVQLLPLSFSGFVVDTPGVREFGLWGIEKEELSFYFRDMEPFINDCKFSGCTHIHEPSCAVKRAVDNQLIHKKRYKSYISLLHSLN